MWTLGLDCQSSPRSRQLISFRYQLLSGVTDSAFQSSTAKVPAYICYNWGHTSNGRREQKQCLRLIVNRNLEDLFLFPGWNLTQLWKQQKTIPSRKWQATIHLDDRHAARLLLEGVAKLHKYFMKSSPWFNSWWFALWSFTCSGWKPSKTVTIYAVSILDCEFIGFCPSQTSALISSISGPQL